MNTGGRTKTILLSMAMAIVAAAPLVSQRGQPAQQNPQQPQAPAQSQVAPPPSAPGRINGVVYVSGTTTPIANVAISVSVPAGPRGRGADGTPVPALDPANFTAKTDGSGHFTINNVPAGNRSVMAQLEGYFGPSQNGIYPTSVRRPAIVVSQQTVEVKFELITGVAIIGRV